MQYNEIEEEIPIEEVEECAHVDPIELQILEIPEEDFCLCPFCG